MFLATQFLQPTKDGLQHLNIRTGEDGVSVGVQADNVLAYDVKDVVHLTYKQFARRVAADYDFHFCTPLVRSSEDSSVVNSLMPWNCTPFPNDAVSRS